MIAPDVAQVPNEAIEFSKALSALAEQYGIREVSATIRIDTGVGSKYWNRTERENIIQNMTVHVSKKDGRGRPRTQVSVTALTEVTVRAIYEPNSSD